MDVMKQSTSVYMITDEADDCKDPPSDDDQMMKYDAAMTVACEEAARGDTVCMCASMGMLGMGQFSYDLGFTKMWHMQDAAPVPRNGRHDDGLRELLGCIHG